MKRKLSKRARTGALASAAGIFLNLALAAAKIAVGAVFGLVSVIADGVNNLSDCGSGAVTLISFRIAEKPADKEHPFGHRRAEYIASLIVSLIVLFFGIELIRESAVKIFSNSGFNPSVALYIVLVASIAVKAGMAGYYFAVHRRIQSDALRAAAIDSASDCAATSVVLAGVLIYSYCGVSVDGYAGVLVALFILWQGGVLLKEAISKLLGQAPDKKIAEGIKSALLSGGGVLGVHDLRLFSFGGDNLFATAHVEMDSSVPPLEAHAVLDGLEKTVKLKFNVDLTAHLDPVDTGDEEAQALKGKIDESLKGLVTGLEVHDIRLVRGAGKKLVFDAGVPFDCPISDGELQNLIKSKISPAANEVGIEKIIITVDRE